MVARNHIFWMSEAAVHGTIHTILLLRKKFCFFFHLIGSRWGCQRIFLKLDEVGKRSGSSGKGYQNKTKHLLTTHEKYSHIGAHATTDEHFLSSIFYLIDIKMLKRTKDISH